MTNTKSFERKSFSPASLHGQGMRKAAKPFWNAQSAWKNEANSGTCSSPVFCVAKNGPKKNGKQIAVQDDKVMGLDVHIMVVPSGNGTTTVPLPHPFIGKLAEQALR